MDVQGSQYHLLTGAGDWNRCVDANRGQPLGEDRTPAALEFDDDLGVLRLRRLAPPFRRAGRSVPVDPAARRGAGRDRFGTWYWIAEDGHSLLHRPAGATTTTLWWSADLVGSGCAPGGDFATCTAGPPPELLLQGLTVTSRQYLLAGYLHPGAGGLLVFDLQAGGDPQRMPWPTGSGFVPWDLADTPDGGALVLDQVNCTYWRLDSHLRVRSRRLGEPTPFRPVGAPGAPAVARPGAFAPIGVPLVAPSPSGDAHPVSIEPGPGGGVLILDSDPGRGYSLVQLYRADRLAWTVSLADAVEAVDTRDPTLQPHRYSLLGHDLAYSTGPLAGAGEAPLCYVADSEGNQVVAFALPADPDPAGNTGPASARFEQRPDFLPLRRRGGKALVRAGPGIWYDFADRWVPLEPFGECRFALSGRFTTPAAFTAGLPSGPDGAATVPTPAGVAFDSGRPGCVWHRLLLDAQIPGGTSVTVRARGNDDPDLLADTGWLAQPTPYQRSGPAELPWFDPWADRGDARGDGTGTWELLFQQVTGRYVELEITLTGNGRGTPLLRSLRAWFPRFSYPDHYLPAIYSGADSADRFLERLLANFEGFYTALEERIEHSHLVLDVRTAGAGDLPWLAAWFGLALEPQWDPPRRRFLVRHVDRFYRMRGTVAGLLATLRLFLHDPVLGAPVEDAVFASCGAGTGGRVRIVERFLTRGPVAPASGADPEPNVPGRVAAAAHRFDVLVAAELADDALAMVARIVELGKPAHTSFAVRRFHDLFAIGRARLGIDTALGDPPRFVPLVTGRDGLTGGYLGYPRPFDIDDRIVSDRDHVGALPAL